MKRHKRASKLKYVPEELEWLRLTPAERIMETTRLWQFYLALGGSLDPEPDPQSPFYSLYFKKSSRKKNAGSAKKI